MHCADLRGKLFSENGINILIKCFHNILEFQKYVLKKLVEIMQEVKHNGSAEPSDSSYHVRRMEKMLFDS